MTNETITLAVKKSDFDLLKVDSSHTSWYGCNYRKMK